MGAAASTTFQAQLDEGAVNPALEKFIQAFQPLSMKRPAEIPECSTEEKEKKKYRAARITAWMSADPNGNGMCSLAEIDAWIQKVLQNLYSEEDDYLVVWKRYRPSYIRAFNDAIDIADPKGLKGTTSTTTDSYVTKVEFRLMCAYLCIYAVMYEAFTMLDGVTPESTDDITVGSADDDRRISKEEFIANFGNISGKFGFQACKDVEVGDGNIFALINGQKEGEDAEAGNEMVLLGEWCAWLEKHEIDGGTDVGKALAVGDDP